MSFTHSTIVGHFDPKTLNPSNIVVTKSLNKTAIERLITNAVPPVCEHVAYMDGYVQCWWTGGMPNDVGTLVHEFAYELARREECVAAEMPLCNIIYPDDARQIQANSHAEYARKTQPENGG